jgi:hypothetical protein
VSVNLIADGRGGHRKTGENAMSNIKFYNTNERFGDAGPFDAESKESLADELREWFSACTQEAWMAESDLRESMAGHGETWMSQDEWKEEHFSGLRSEYINGLVAQYHGDPRLIFDNGGGVTLQLPGFAHHYDDAKQCAEDIASWIDGEDTSGWDGNEEDAVFDPTYEQERNGGYRVMSLAYFTSLSIDDMQGQSWSNIKQLYVALAMAILG